MHAIAVHALNLLATLSLAYPLWRTWRALWPTSLRAAAGWMVLAWLGWVTLSIMPLVNLPERPVQYLALCLSACSFVAILGARKPGMMAWNFVVVGLLAILSLPLIQQTWSDGGWRLEEVWAYFLGAILAVGCVNYCFTRLALIPVVLTAVFGFRLYSLAASEQWLLRTVEQPQMLKGMQVAVCSTIWLATLLRWRWPALDTVDLLWAYFQECYGLVWGKRVQEQFNAAAKNAGWNVRLEWLRGLQPEPGHPPPTEEQQAEMLLTLQATMKRFGIAVA
jgi:hypothetical protein